MTNNIVAQFSSSIWSNEEAEIAESLGFSVGDFKEYPVVSGSVISGEYNETLDSATILLSQVPLRDRLFLKPYDYVRIYDKSGNTGFDKLFLVDNFNETENNIKEHIFGYTVNLMSETKWTEKIQCPNLAITHKVNEDGTITKKTIWDYIKQYMELYVPKIKMAYNDNNVVKWHYEPLIKFPINYVNDSFQEEFNINDFDSSNKVQIYFPLDASIDEDCVEITNYSISGEPSVNWRYQSIYLDKENRRFVFSGEVIRFPNYDTVKQESFDEQDFTLVADGYEITLVVAQLGDDVLSSSVEIVGAHTSTSIVWETQQMTYNPSTKQIIFNGTTRERGSGTVYVEYVCQSFSGSVQINYRYADFENDAFYERFNVPCADLGFSSPTLRQLLTTLMLQVGCIPTVVNRTLSYLDFQLEAQNFGNGDYTVGNTVNFIKRSLSSDSYANTLVNISNNVLDSGNQVVSEVLGFRDQNSVLLKQEENLYLETKFPIYKVNKFLINAYVKADVSIKDLNKNLTAGSQALTWTWNINISKISNRVKIDFGLSYTEHSQDPGNWGFRIIGRLRCFKYEFDAMQDIQIDETYYSNHFVPSADGVLYFNLTDSEYDMFYFYGYIGFFDPTEHDDGKMYSTFVSNFSGSKEILTLFQKNITPLLVEQSVRQNLSNDFVTMVAETTNYETSAANINTLAKYIYGTVGYNIGSNRISGFSSTYNVGSTTVFGWIQANYTYIENIWNFLVKNRSGQNSIDQTVRREWGNFPIMKDDIYYFDYDTYGPGELQSPGDDENYTFNNAIPYNPAKINGGVARVFTSNINFSYLWFDIEYQPLNSFNLSFVKSIEQIDMPIEQYDSNASGLTDFDRLSLHEQEQVDRIGNEVLSISQRTDNFNQIQTFDNGPLYFMEDTNRSGEVDEHDNGIKYIIFKQSFTIKNNCFNVSYVGSKDAVLKDYFTSIRTKYRAYQYVDYNSSTLRKEKDVIYARISENDWYDGDDKILFGPYNINNFVEQQKQMVKLLGSWSAKNNSHQDIDYSSYNSVKHNVLASRETQAKNDVSVIASDNFFALIYEECDNVGLGTYMTNQSILAARNNNNLFLGGIPQTWQIWEEDYNAKHIVSFSAYLDISNTFSTYIDASSVSQQTIMDNMEKIINLPILNSSYLDLYNSNKVVFSVVSNNKGGLVEQFLGRTFYKDYAERINHTVEFIYYTDSKNILWTENFFKLNDVSGCFQFDGIVLASLEGEEFELRKEEYVRDFEPLLVDGDVVTFNDGSSDNTNPYILVNWSLIPNITQFKVVAVRGSTVIYYYDVLGFKKGEENLQKFYLTLNDTKSDYVMSEKNGILHRRYKVSTNTTERTVENIYEED